MDPFIYFLPSSLNHKNLQKYFLKHSQYRIILEKSEKFESVILDTFDSNLKQASNMLFKVGKLLFLYALPTGQLIEQVSPENWFFASDLKDGPVTAQLKQVSSLRAFLPIAKVELCLEHGLLIDDEEKTVARFHNLTLSSGKNTIVVGSTQYLRGYAQAHADLCLSLKKIGAMSCQDIGQVYDFLGIEREKITKKPTCQLIPGAPIRVSAKCIVNAFLENARHNESGIVADYDTEFLHDYRVSLRKVRSVLSLFKGVFSKEDTACLKKDFSSLMQVTNTLRDLDVYLLTKEKYFKMVPTDVHEGLDILFNYFAGERLKEQERVSTFLREQTYLKEIGRLGKLFGDASTLPAGPRGEDHSLAYACRLLLKSYGKICKIARNIDEETEDDTIHQLRIDCKKLRYLMEFFGSLFPQTEIKALIKSLKILQDNLGNFNDYSVQQIFLRQVLSEKINAFSGSELKVAESIGALTAMLHRLQKEERQQVMKNFILFDSSETKATFTKLFHVEEKVHENNSPLQQ